MANLKQKKRPRATPGLAQARKLVWTLGLILLAGLDPAQGAFSNPTFIGVNGDYCDTIGTAFDVYKLSSATYFMIAGTTRSERMVNGQTTYTQMKGCLATPIPFLQVWRNTAIYQERYFNEIIKFGAILGRYKQITAVAYSDRVGSGTTFSDRAVAMALQFANMAGEAQDIGTTIMFLQMATNLPVIAVYNVDHPSPPRKDIIYHHSSTTAASGQYLEFFNRKAGYQLYETFYINLAANTQESRHIVGASGLEAAYGGTVMMRYEVGIIIGGSMKITGRTGFIPVLYIEESSELTYMTPTADTQPFYSIDKMVFNPSSFKGMWSMGVPRDASNNILTSLYPVQVFRHHYGGDTSCTGSKVITTSYLVKMKTQEADKFILGLDISMIYPTYVNLLFYKTTSLQADMPLDGTENNYIGLARGPMDIWCKNGGATTYVGAFGGGTVELTTTEQVVSTTAFDSQYEYFGRPCYRPSGVTGSCVLIDAGFKNNNQNPPYFAYATTQDVYYNDQNYHEIGMLSPTSAGAQVTYNNGNGTTNGKFITVQHSMQTYSTNNVNMFTNHPTYGRYYDKWIWDYSKTYDIQASISRSSTVVKTLSAANCDSNQVTLSAASNLDGLVAGRNRIQVYAGDSFAEGFNLAFPFTISCSGTYCDQCPIKMMIKPSQSSGSLSQSTSYIPRTTTIDTTGKVVVPFVQKVNYYKSYNLYLLAYLKNYADTTETVKMTSTYSLGVNQGLAYDWATCNTLCKTSSSNQIPMRLYKYGNACYEALTNCIGCFSSSINPAHLRAMTCPSRVCYSNDTIGVTYNLDLDLDITDLPLTFNMASNLTNPSQLTLDLVRLGNGTHLDYVPLNSTYNGLFTMQGTSLLINKLNNNLEFQKETFEVEIKSSTCSHLDNQFVAEASAPTQDVNHNLPTIGVKFQMKLMRCGEQNFALRDATPLYFEVPKDTGDEEILSVAQKQAVFVLSSSTFCPVTAYSLLDDQQQNFTTTAAARRLQATTADIQNFIKLSSWQSNNPVVINTAFNQHTNELQQVFSFHLSAQTEGKDRFQQYLHQPIKVVVGCFREPSITASVKALPTVVSGIKQEVFNYTDRDVFTPHVKIKLFKNLNESATEADIIKTFNMTELVKWDTTVSNCFASNLSMYSDPALSTLQTGNDVFLNANPMNKNESGLMDPVLSVNRTTPFNKVIYLKGTTNDGSKYDVFQANVIVCGQERVQLATSVEMRIRQFKLFDVLWHQEEGQPEWEVFNLTGLFEVISDQPNVNVTDCPIDHYILCNTSVSACTNTTNITTNETFIVNQTANDTFLYMKRDPLERQQFQLTASTESGVSFTQVITLQVCGKENITVDENYLNIASTSKLKVRKDMEVDTEPETYDLSEIFKNDLPECPIIGYKLVKRPEVSSDEIAQNAKTNYQLETDKETFTIEPLIQSTLTFYLMAYTQSNKFATVEINSQIYKVLPLPNEFPSYPELDEQIDVEITYTHEGILESTKEIEIPSGPLEDPEEDEVELIDVEERAMFLSVKKNADSSFVLVINPAFLMATDEGCHDVLITVSDFSHEVDEVGETKVKICLTLTIKPEPLPAPELPEFTFEWDWEAVDKEEEVVEVVVEKVEVEEEPYVPLLCEISITTLGKVTMTCNQPIKTEKIISKLEVGRRLQDADDSIFSLSMEPGAYEGSEEVNLSDLEFVWALEGYDDFNNALSLQVNYTNAIAISPNVIPDVLTVDVPDPTVLESRDYGKPLEMNGQPIATGVKKQMPNTIETQRFDSGTQSTNQGMTGTAILTFLLNFIFAGAMKEIIGSILGLQIILFASLISVKMPGNIATYYQRLKPIATFNIVVVLQQLTDFFFSYDTPEQIKLRENIITTAQDLNILYHNALKNLGNFLFLLGFYFSKVWRLIWLYMKKAMVSRIRKGPIRKQIEAKKKELFFNKVIQICTAGFIPISISIYYQFMGKLYSTPGEVAGVMISFVCFFLCYMLLPYALIQAILVEKETLLIPEFKQRWGASYAGIKLQTRWQRAHKFIFILRRFALLYIGLELHMMPPIQLILLNLMNIFAIIYMGNTEPLPTVFDMKMELFNEAMVSSITYHLFMFTDALPDPTAQYLIGWSLVVNLSLMLFVNSFFVVKGILNKFRMLIVKFYRKLKFRRDMRNAMKKQFDIQKQLQLKAQQKEENRKTKRLENTKKTQQILQNISDPLYALSQSANIKANKRIRGGRPKKTNLSIIQEEMSDSRDMIPNYGLDIFANEEKREKRVESDKVKQKILQHLLDSNLDSRQTPDLGMLETIDMNKGGEAQEPIIDESFEYQIDTLILQGLQEAKEEGRDENPGFDSQRQ